MEASRKASFNWHKPRRGVTYSPKRYKLGEVMKWLVCILLMFSACTIDQGFKSPVVPIQVPGDIQPLPEDWTEDQWLQPPAIEVDLIFALDQSCSMMTHRAKVASQTAPMISMLTQANVDYRVIITSTGDGDPELFNGDLYATPDNTIDPETTIYNRINSYIGDSGEKGIFSVYSVLTSDWRLSALRVGVPLHIIVVSDEPDQTSPINDATKQDMLNVYESWRQAKSGELTFNSIVGIQDQAGCHLWFPDPTRYIRMTQYYPGVVINICSDDWTQPIRQITRDALDTVIKFHLHDIPVAETIEVTEELDGITLLFIEDEDWVYDPFSNSVFFLDDYIPEGVTRIKYQLAETNFYKEE
jgi:hypothetical protein